MSKQTTNLWSIAEKRLRHRLPADPVSVLPSDSATECLAGHMAARLMAVLLSPPPPGVARECVQKSRRTGSQRGGAALLPPPF